MCATKFALEKASLSLQEHLTLLRQLAMSFPDKYAELNALSSADIEVDFFANVAHLQVHRRIRALRRLVKVSLLPSCYQQFTVMTTCL